MNNVYEKAASILGIEKEVIKDVYETYWKYIRETIEKLPLKENLTLEEFEKLKTNFNIPSLGKLSCNYPRYLRVKSTELYKRKKNENKEN